MSLTEVGIIWGSRKYRTASGSMRINVIGAAAIYAIDTDDLGVDYVVRMDVRKGVARPCLAS